jgi:hypothetical protein
VERRDEPLEGDVLVGVGVDGRAAGAAEQLAEPGLAGEVGPEDQGVGEEADEALQLGPGAAGDVRADGEVLPAGVAVEQDLEGGQQRHVQRRPLLAAQRAHGLEGRPGDGRGSDAAAPAQRPGLRPIGGQLQRGEALELPGPVVELTLEDLALQPLALPGGEVGVLDGRLGQRRGLAGAEGIVEGGYLADEHAERPAVGDDVVHRHLGDVLGVGEPDQPGADQGASRQVEGPRGLLADTFQGSPEPTVLGDVG